MTDRSSSPRHPYQLSDLLQETTARTRARMEATKKAREERSPLQCVYDHLSAGHDSLQAAEAILREDDFGALLGATRDALQRNIRSAMSICEAVLPLIPGADHVRPMGVPDSETSDRLAMLEPVHNPIGWGSPPRCLDSPATFTCGVTSPSASDFIWTCDLEPGHVRELHHDPELDMDWAPFEMSKTDLDEPAIESIHSDEDGTKP